MGWADETVSLCRARMQSGHRAQDRPGSQRPHIIHRDCYQFLQTAPPTPAPALPRPQPGEQLEEERSNVLFTLSDSEEQTDTPTMGT